MRYSARQRAAFLAAALAVGATWAAPALAADEPKWATTLLEDDVVAVGVINLRQIDVPASVEAAQSLGIMGDAEAEQLLSGARVAQQRLAQLTQRGVERAYVLVRLADLTSGGSTWIVELASDADGAGAADLLKQQLEAARAGGGLHDLGGMLPRELQVVAGVVAGAPSQERLQQLREAHVAAVRDDARDALAALADVDVGFVVFGDADSRRVLRETFPQLPAPFRAIDGRLLADGVRWAAVTASLAGNPPTVTIETADAATAVALQDAAAQGVALLEALAQTAGEDANGPAAALREVAPLLRPTVDGTRLTLKLLDDEAELNALRTIVAPSLQASRAGSLTMQRMESFKHIALAMFNYEEAHKTFPPAASYDAQGRPLLSWRVTILPYLGEGELGELYNEFRLDEPWDSDHNRKLIARMPSVYADRSEPALAAAGRTTHQVPVGPGTVFDGPQGTKLRDITDGASQTILLVEVTAERAVPWTKPEDWEVDFSDPLRGVRRTAGERQGDGFVIARCDGSAAYLAGIEPEELAAMLTRSGGETVKSGR